MSATVNDSKPLALPFAPRPINGEPITSWARRLACANGMSLEHLLEYIVAPVDASGAAGQLDYGAPKHWRAAMAALARVPEIWIWALDLQQQFPGVDRDWFLRNPRCPDRLMSAYCPDCFRMQIANGKTLHLKAEWMIALATRCPHHSSPLLIQCPQCGTYDPVCFRLPRLVRCVRCDQDLTANVSRQRTRPVLASFGRALADAFACKVPEAFWAPNLTARAFRRLVADLLWMFTTTELIDRSYGFALVDRVARLRPKYGRDFAKPFCARSWAHREAVASAIVLMLLGSDADCDFKASGRISIKDFLGAKSQRLVHRVRYWPAEMSARIDSARILRANGKIKKRGKSVWAYPDSQAESFPITRVLLAQIRKFNARGNGVVDAR